MVLAIIGFVLVSGLALRITYTWGFSAGVDSGVRIGAYTVLSHVPPEILPDVTRAIEKSTAKLKAGGK